VDALISILPAQHTHHQVCSTACNSGLPKITFSPQQVPWFIVHPHHITQKFFW
jgi:hypothetical protein